MVIECFSETAVSAYKTRRFHNPELHENLNIHTL
jgi:hypothetical protein